MRADVVVIGAGPAGLAAAEAAAVSGAQVLVLEREPTAGGILPQCVHDGFGMHLFDRSLTGPEYAQIWHERARDAGARFALSTTVLDVEQAGSEESFREGALGFRIRATGAALGGCVQVEAASVVVATGCRERVRGALGIPGTRPSGVMTAGEAQYLVNRRNLMPGRRVVILGSGDIGLIMARRMAFEGAQVRLVLGAQGTGLLRNHIRCIQDLDIPYRSGWGVANVHGKGCLSAVTVAPLLAQGGFDLARRERVSCDLLLLACGLIPEREVIAGFGEQLPEGLFVCGNAQHPHDLVDQVTQEGIRCGLAAARVAGCAPEVAHAGERVAALEEMAHVAVQEPKGRLSELEDAGGAASAGAGAPDAPLALACTACPAGCLVKLHGDGTCEGNGCERGRDAVEAERSHPVRMFTGTVRIEGAEEPLLPVRTDRDIPRASLAAVQGICKELRVTAPVQRGQVLVEDACGTGACLIASASCEACRMEVA